MKKAIITGVTGQDGSYLAELLLSRGFKVFGGIRRNSDFTTKRINHIFNNDNFVTFNYDATDPNSVIRVLLEDKIDYFFNLAALSHVGTSFDIPNYATQADGASVVQLLELIKQQAPSCVFYQASTSELFGGSPGQAPQDIDTALDPKSPYAVAKLMAFYSALNARRSGDLMTVNGILFNHESPRRGKTFVTKKISQYVASHHNKNARSSLQLGNLGAIRDWGFAPDYVEIMLDSVLTPDEAVYCCGTGIGYTVRQFCEFAFSVVGIDIVFEGEGLDEKGIDKSTGQVLVEVNEKYFRPLEVDILIAGKSGNKLRERSFLNLEGIVENMVSYDLSNNEYGGFEDAGRYSKFWK